jgi:hypothetical protein
MSFLASFATGFATQATKDIEERDKELREKADKYWEALLKEREKATLRADKRVEELTTQSKQIRTLLPDITDAQLTTILHSGQSDTLLKALIEAQTKQGRTFKAGELITDVPESQISLSDYLSSETRRGVPKLEMPAMEDRLPFGLRSTAMQDARAKYLKEAGVSGEEKQEAFKRPVEGGRINYAALAAPKEDKLTEFERNLRKLKDAWSMSTDQTTKDALATEISSYMNLGKVERPDRFTPIIDALKIEYANTDDPNKKRQLNARILELSSLGKPPEKGEDKAPTRADFFRLLKNAERTGVASVENRLGGATFVDSADGRLLVKGIDSEARGVLDRAVNVQIKSVVDTISDTQGRVPQGMREALASFGIKTDKNGVPILSDAAPSAPPSPAPPPVSGVAAARAKTKTIVRTGTIQSGPDKGKKVIEYSDGTREIQ